MNGTDGSLDALITSDGIYVDCSVNNVVCNVKNERFLKCFVVMYY